MLEKLGVDKTDVDVLGGVVDIFARQFQTDQQNRLNFMATAGQNVQNLELYKLQSARNEPAFQRRLLEKAGYNPNLLYGHGVVATGTPPQMQKSELHAPDISGWQQIALNDINMDILRAQKEVAIADARRVNAEADIREHDAGQITKQKTTTSTDPWYLRMIDRARRFQENIGSRMSKHFLGDRMPTKGDRDEIQKRIRDKYGRGASGSF